MLSQVEDFPSITRAEPVAIIGLGCRLPGAPSPDRFWRLLRDGEEAIRYPAADEPESPPSCGGFLDDVESFDAAFFGIAPKEAAAMDPRQRLTLELSWEALENARILPQTLQGSRTGVFIGAIGDDYATLLAKGGQAVIGHHSMVGLHRAIIPNRVSYRLGLQGPSLAIDTAQSSSLVAVHLAAESLRSGESTLAIAGGIQLNLAVESAVSAERFGGLSPDGRCFTFDERANGFVRGEGGGLIVMKLLSRAIADGDPVRCLILGSAVNNDGTSESLAVPSRQAQANVIREACERAGVRPAEVQYVELHGSATAVGDPVEASALGDVFSGARDGLPLEVGSVKTNIGHLEAAAGIAGLLKTVLSIEHRQLPPSLNFETPNPRIPLYDFGLAVRRELGTWSAPDRQLVAGVSSFGMGGTNCHLVLAEPPREPGSPGPVTVASAAGAPLPWVLSGRSEQALRGQAELLLAHAQTRTDQGALDVGLSLATTRSAFEHRAVVLARDRAGLLTGLAELANGTPAVKGAGPEETEVICGYAEGAQRPVFVFGGQGSQWPGMGARLLESSDVFRAGIAECAQALAPFVDWSLTDVLRSADGAGAAKLTRDDVVQPVLWAMMVSLARVWASAGVTPAAVLGHSQGEIAAATVAGALSVADGARVVALRSQALTRITGCGGMLSVAAPADDVAASFDRWPGRLWVAAVNGPSATVVSGDLDALEEFAGDWEADGYQVRMIPVSYASHCPSVEQLREEILAALAPVDAGRVSVPFVSSVSGEPIADPGALGGQYWFENLRRPVRFESAVRHLLKDGNRVFVECGPHPILAGSIQDTIEHAMGAGETRHAVIGTLRRNEGGMDQFWRSAARAYAHGVPVNWGSCVPGASLVDLPTYAFQRQRHWASEIAPWGARDSRSSDPASKPARPPARPAGPPAGDEAAPRHTGQALSPATEEGELLAAVRNSAAAVLGDDSGGEIQPTRTFKDQGLDSYDAIELTDRLSAETGLPLSPSLPFEHPTPAALARYLSDALKRQGSGAVAATVSRPGPRPGPAASVPEGPDPIAVVGMSCRYPGGIVSPEDLWNAVAHEVTAFTEFPANRGWDLAGLYHPDPDSKGTSYARRGGFLHDADQFDAAFFGISPREAVAMDPQQRLLLEGAWEALERAGVDPATLRGTPTGVFVGVMTQDYGPRLYEPADGHDGFLLTGTSASVASGRISYVLGLEGPAMTVDTACSSSLVAVHLACLALHRAECELALAGGVTVMANPGMFIEFSRQRGLAPDGRCKPFAAAADGTAWAEGMGMLVLERLSTARRRGHKVLALLRGSAVNQDGASNGLTAPSGSAQRRVIQQALASAHLSPSDVDVVEAHGTGTALGDPIEARALQAVYGQDRPRDRPLWIGSLKSNIGHAQAAAGVGGLIKMVMALGHAEIPATLGVDSPSPEVDWSAAAVRVASRARPWPQAGRAMRAGVSSFGMSGTNSHVIVEQGPAESLPARAAGQFTTSVPWVITARTQAALTQRARLLHDVISTQHDPGDTGYALAATRTAFEHRAVILAREIKDFKAALSALAAGRQPANVITGRARGDAKTAFLFTGQGSQRPGMGGRLYQAFPAFAGALDEVCAHLDTHLGRPLRDLMFGQQGSAEAALLYQTAYAQPALFAMETALFRLLESFGLTPNLMLGHSIGEITAAHVAGVFSLEDAAALVAARGRLMGNARADGLMMSVQASEEELLPLLKGREWQVSIASLNGPSSTVISGDAAAVREIAQAFAEQGRRTGALRTSHAFHSAHMDSVLLEFRQVFKQLRPQPPEIPVVSCLTGQLATKQQLLSPDYWVQQVRRPVRYLHGLQSLRAEGVTTFVELGPAAVLTAMSQHLVAKNDDTVAVTSAVQPGEPEDETVLAAAALLYTRGAALAWDAWFEGDHRPVELPTYPFERQSYWLSPSGGQRADRFWPDGAIHPLLAGAIELADGDATVLTGQVGLGTHPWLAGHQVFGHVLLPGSAFVDLALHAAGQVGCDRVDELTIETPLALRESVDVQLQVRIGAPDEAGRQPISVHSRLREGTDRQPWTRHATGFAARGQLAATGGEPWPPPGAEQVDIGDIYSRLTAKGLRYGLSFQGLRALWRRGGELFAEVAVPEDPGPEKTGYIVLLDSILHALVAQSGPVLLPFSWSGVTGHGTTATTVRARLTPTGDGEFAISAVDADGSAVLDVRALALLPASQSQINATTNGRDWLYEVDWAPVPTSAPARSLAGWAVLEADGLGDTLSRAGATLVAAGTTVSQLIVCREPGSGEPVPATLRQRLDGLLAIITRWLADEQDPAARLAVVTIGAVAARPGDCVRDLAGAAEWGLLRSAQTENPGRIILLDLDGTAASRAALPAALSTGEQQLAVRDGAVYAARLSRARDALAAPAGNTGWRLALARAGSLDGLSLEPSDVANRPLEPGQVRIAVRATGLNFRDVVIALRMVPDDGRPVGWEGAGVVTETAPDVCGLAPGDRVMGLLTGGIGPVSVTDQRLLTTVPKGWSFAQAAGVPVAFLTAYFALIDLAGLRPGESVLIHAATGGVGMAACQVARHLGAEVYATASPRKWQTLREDGFDDAHIASSRSLEFAERFPRGINVVLNCLAREYVDASLGLQSSGGRFIEMGKTDIRGREQVDAIAPGVGYQAFDLLDAGADRIAEMLAELRRLCAEGVLGPLPVTAWDIREAPHAIRFLSQAKHVGKVILTLPRALDTEGTVLVTGATGTLGSLIAGHLAAVSGARRFLLLSRRGADADGAAALRTQLSGLGAQADIVSCDIADRNSLAAVLARIPDEHPLTAVVHAAGVLADGTVAALTPDSVDTVLRPKADGAWNLHELTADCDLAEFILYSSVAGTFGTAGQGNYAAANAFLDGLACRRRRSGLPGTSIAWGLWEAASGMTRHLGDSDRARLVRASGAPLTASDGLALFDAARGSSRPQLVAAKLDSASLRPWTDARPVSPLFSEGLAAAPPRQAGASARPSPGLADLTGPGRQKALLDLVKTQAARVLGHSGQDRIEGHEAFGDLGFSSLTAVELRNRLSEVIGMRLPATVMFRYPTPVTLAEHLDARLAEAADRPGAILPVTSDGNGSSPA